MFYDHIFPVLIGYILFLCLRYLVIKIWSRWQTTMIFINPETGRCYSMKERKKKYRYYVSGIRVPYKLYNLL